MCDSVLQPAVVINFNLITITLTTVGCSSLSHKLINVHVGISRWSSDGMNGRLFDRRRSTSRRAGGAFARAPKESEFSLMFLFTAGRPFMRDVSLLRRTVSAALFIASRRHSVASDVAKTLQVRGVAQRFEVRLMTGCCAARGEPARFYRAVISSACHLSSLACFESG